MRKLSAPVVEIGEDAQDNSQIVDVAGQRNKIGHHIPAGTKHWHGAAKDSWFVHLTVSVPADGASTEWREPVSDADYFRLK